MICSSNPQQSDKIKISFFYLVRLALWTKILSIFKNISCPLRRICFQQLLDRILCIYLLRPLDLEYNLTLKFLW